MSTRGGSDIGGGDGSTVPVPVGPLIGRQAELGAVGELLGRARIVTLTGPPGVGKTRLALAAAAATGRPARWIDLSRASTADAATAQLVHAVRPGDPSVLLIVDNFEHVLDAADMLAEILTRTGGASALVTSRERLRLSGEVEYAVPPLRMPADPDVADVARLAVIPSVALLLDRCADPSFVMTERNARAVAEICIRLDGLPLALELAAARLRVFTPGELAFRLENRLALLTRGARDVPARHRALRAAIDWSHDLLPERERVMLRRLAVFVGGWTVPAAAQVCGFDEDEALDLVESLVDKSLVRRSTRADAGAEFALLDSVREFAGEKLALAGEADRIRGRHAAYYGQMALLIEAGIGTSDEPLWAAWSHWEHGNLRAALDRARTAGHAADTLPLVFALGWHYYIRGMIGTGRALVENAFADLEEAGVADASLTAGLIIRAIFSRESGSLDLADAFLRRARAISVKTGDLRRTAISSAFLGHVTRDAGRYDEAADHYARAAEIYLRLGHPRGVAWSLQDRGLLDRDRGRLGSAQQLLLESLSMFRELDYPWACAWSAWGAGTVLLRRGAIADAATLLVEALKTFARVEDRRGVAQSLEALAHVAARRGEPGAAMKLHAAADRLRVRLEAPRTPGEQSLAEEAQGDLAAQLGPVATDRERHAGATMPLDEAMDLATDVAARPSRVAEAAVALTNREREVADLIAAGRTNRQLARALGISERTAEVHVRNIMAKLGTASRAGIAAWVTARHVPS